MPVSSFCEYIFKINRGGKINRINRKEKHKQSMLNLFQENLAL